MALLSYVVILPRDLPNPSGPLSSQLVITEPKAKHVAKGGHTWSWMMGWGPMYISASMGW